MGQRSPISQEREKLISLKFGELHDQADADLQKNTKKKVEEFGERNLLGSGIAQREIRDMRISEIIKLADELVKIDIDAYGDPSSEDDVDTIMNRVKVLVDAQTKGIYIDARRVTGVDYRQELEANRTGILSNIRRKLLIALYENQLAVQKDINKETKTDEKTTMKQEDYWLKIRKGNISKKEFGKKINFIKDKFKREIIFRDVEQSFILLKMNFYKPASILAGGVIEELLRLYLVHKGIIGEKQYKKFDEYITLCKSEKLLKLSKQSLTDVARHLRNLVHLELEKSKRDSITKSDATIAVESIFSVANSFSNKNRE